MIRLSRSIALAAPTEQVWQTLLVFGDLALWHPAVETCRASGGRHASVGAARHVTTRDGLAMDEELVAASGRDHRLEILTRTAPFPVSLMWQALTVFGVSTTGGAVLRWEVRAEGPPVWTDRIREWFGNGYIPAGLHGLAGHLAATNDTVINN